MSDDPMLRDARPRLVGGPLDGRILTPAPAGIAVIMPTQESLAIRTAATVFVRPKRWTELYRLARVEDNGIDLVFEHDPNGRQTA